MFDAISEQGGIVTLMIGDGLMAVFGAPLPLPDHEVSAVRAAQEMCELIALFNDNRLTPEQRAALDKIALTSVVQFDERKDAPAHQTSFESGDTDGVHFRFSSFKRGELTRRIRLAIQSRSSPW